MNKGGWVIGLVVAVLIVVGAFVVQQDRQKEKPTEIITPNETLIMGTLTLTSSEFENGGVIPSEYTCDGSNINPPLAISGVPEDAQSLVLIVDDPDAVKPAGKVWDHWVVFNIPTNTTDIATNDALDGVVGINGGGSLGYQGPCPPDAEHRYFFKLYALDTTLELPEGTTKTEVETAMEGRILDQVELMGRYNRS